MKIDWDLMEKEAVERLRSMVRFDTTNPPGNELPLVRKLAEELEGEGLEPQVLESAEGRGSLAVRLRGDGSERPVLLLSHLDVVPVEPERWSHPPFAAEVEAYTISLNNLHIGRHFMLPRKGAIEHGESYHRDRSIGIEYASRTFRTIREALVAVRAGLRKSTVSYRFYGGQGNGEYALFLD